MFKVLPLIRYYVIGKHLCVGQELGIVLDIQKAGVFILKLPLPSIKT